MPRISLQKSRPNSVMLDASLDPMSARIGLLLRGVSVMQDTLSKWRKAFQHYTRPETVIHAVGYNRHLSALPSGDHFLPIDPARLLSRHFAPLEHVYTARDTILYALGIGVGFDPLDERALRFTYEGSTGDRLRAMPTMANVLGYPGFWAREPDTGIAWQRLVHAEQEIAIHATLPSHGRVIAQNRVSALWDRGADRGALMQQQREIRDAHGVLLATVTQLTLMRADGGFGESSPGSAPPPHAMPERVPDAVCDLPTVPQLALLYRLSGDYNPLHADPAVARAAGFDRPILHGMATMGVAAHAVLRAMLDHDESRFAGMRVRFTAPAIPGDTLRTEMWMDGAVISFRTTAVQRGAIVLNNGRVSVKS